MTAGRVLALLVSLAASAVILASAVTAGPLAATAVSTKTALRGHLPELGDNPSVRVFVSAEAYDDYQAGLGPADIFPSSTEMTWVNFQTEILALYHRGSDVGGRCLRVDSANPNASISGNTTTLNLMWAAETCGAPSSAHHPFVIVALRKTATDGTTWISPSGQICASAPEVADSTACASLSGAVASPTPTAAPTRSPSPGPQATALPTRSPAPTATAATQRTPTPTGAAARTPTPAAATASATPTLVALGSPAPASTPPSALVAGAFIGVGSALVVLSVIFLLRRGRDYRV